MLEHISKDLKVYNNNNNNKNNNYNNNNKNNKLSKQTDVRGSMWVTMKEFKFKLPRNFKNSGKLKFRYLKFKSSG